MAVTEAVAAVDTMKAVARVAVAVAVVQVLVDVMALFNRLDS